MADDFDFDAMLEGDSSLSSPVKTSQQFEDELFDFLDTPTLQASASAGNNSENSTEGASSDFSLDAPVDDNQDFLSWLEETPKSTSFAAPKTVIPTSPMAPKSMETFFDEVFGDDVMPSPSAKSKLSSHSIDQSDPANYEHTLLEIITSSFPDVMFLKQTIFEHGYVPVALRAQVWTLILSGNNSDDEEARHFNSSTSTTDVVNKKAMQSDCAALIGNLSNSSQWRSGEEMSRDMQDLLSLYCLRRNLAYSSVLGQLLSPLLLTTHTPSRTMASSCFYSLVSSFAPLVNLNTKALEIASGAIHSWLRLALSYHSPAIVQHLDRVLPGWEQPVTDVNLQQSTQQRAYSGLDDLERELGLDVLSSDLPPLGSVSPLSSGGGVIQSAPPSRGSQPTGCIPTHWISGLFAGSLPPDQAAVLLDWAILNNERYAGFYFVVTLLEVYSQTLLRMNGSHIRQWFEDVASNKVDWFRSIAVQLSPAAEPNTPRTAPPAALASEAVVVNNWNSFTRGWIHATAVLMNGTPQAFKEALSRTEDWAVFTAEKQRVAVAAELSATKQHMLKTGNKFSDSSSLGDYPQHGEDISDDIFGENDDEPDMLDEEDEDEEDDDIPITQTAGDQAEGSMFGGKSNLMAQFRRLSAQFQGDGKAVDSAPRASEWIHDAKTSPDVICLWASAAEVVPCICSNRRRPMTPEDILLTFQSAVTTQASNDGSDSSDVFNVCFPVTVQVGEGATQTPFFFGIDCRSEAERRLGQFPKAFVMDPSSVTDPEQIAALLQVVEPMAASAHLCIIGSGDDYLRWQYKQANSKRRKRNSTGDSPELLASIVEQNSSLSAVAMFFLKKSFSRVSILDGGFAAAARYLHRADSSLSLMGALIDVNKNELESLLGIPSSEPQKATLMSRIESSLHGDNIKPASQASAASTSAAAPISLVSLISSFTTNHATSVSSAKPVPPVGAAKTVEPAHSKPEPPTNSPVPPVENTNVTAAKTLFSGLGKKISLFSSSSLETIKKNVAAYNAPLPAHEVPQNSAVTNAQLKSFAKSLDFVIDDEEEDDGMGPREPKKQQFADTDSISISRTDIERAQVLALHKMAGLQKGDRILINRDELPGAVLFPCLKVKEIFVDDPALAPASQQTDSSLEEGHGSGAFSLVDNEDGERSPSVDREGQQRQEEEEEETKEGLEGGQEVSPVAPLPNKSPVLTTQQSVVERAMERTTQIRKEIQVHRFLVVSKERFLVLDSNAEGVGSQAVVKSNHHLTELIKMTFRKKDPELVTLHFLNSNAESGATKTKVYRVSKRKDFIDALQKNMQRFK